MAKTLAIVFGIILVIVGILGLMGSSLIGVGGLFVTNGLHDIVHIIFGLILLIVAFAAPMKSAMWLKILGVIFLILAVLGFLVVGSSGSLLGVELNAADHWLHLVLGIVFIVVGWTSKSGSSSMSSGMPMSSLSM